MGAGVDDCYIFLYSENRQSCDCSTARCRVSDVHARTENLSACNGLGVEHMFSTILHLICIVSLIAETDARNESSWIC